MDDFRAAVLGFWFDELEPEQHFIGSPELDANIRQRFLPLYETLMAQPPEADTASAETLLAAIIVLDQFPRNMFRGTAQAFATDPIASKLTHAAIKRGFDLEIDEARRAFIYMPLMHSEDIADQTLCVEKFDMMGGNPHAVEHCAVIAKFGRFPHRNAVLGRRSTADELAYLKTAPRHGQ